MARKEGFRDGCYVFYACAYAYVVPVSTFYRMQRHKNKHKNKKLETDLFSCV